QPTPPASAQTAPPSTAALSGADMKDLGGGVRASKVIGSTVVNDQNETVGKIDDLILSGSGAQEPVAVLSVGGFLGVGSKLVAIRYDELKPAKEKSELMLPGATKDGLKNLPDFEYAK
ncbi:MAG TPA: PRC-barrel domain-containing protein, partial [Stellaceae bacterium]|nr:PRC-barrel domain-containing protein [Stellaceae bacterium]